MTQPVDIVYVEIRPDSDDFGKDLNRQVDDALKTFRNNIKTQIGDVEQEFGAAGKRAGAQFGDGFAGSARDRIRAGAAGFGTDGQDAGGRFGDGFQDQVDAAFTGIVANFRTTGETSGREFGTGFGGQVDSQLGQVSARVRTHGRDAGDGFGEGFRSGFADVFTAVRRDVDSALWGISALASSVGGLLSAGAGVGVVATGIAGIASAAGAAVPAIGALVATLASASGAALALPGAFAAAAVVLGTFKIGVAGIGEALKAAGVAQAASGESAAEYARRVQAAQQTVVQANQRVADSERDLAKATEAVNDARKTAAKQLTDLTEDIDDAQRRERGAVLDLADAAKDLAQAQADQRSGKKTAEDVARAQLAYDNAADSLDDVRKRIQELSTAQTDANRKGIEGSDVVQSALERQRSAQQSLSNAKAAAVSAELALAAAQEKTAASTSKAAEAMEKLAPAGQEVVRALLALQAAYEGVQRSVQQELLGGVADELRETGFSILPVVQRGFVGVAEVLNRQLIGALRALRSEAVKTNLASIFTSARGALDNFTPAVQPLIVALTDVAEVGARVLKSITEGAGEAIAQFAEHVSQLAESGQLEDIILRGVEVLKALGAAAADVFGILSGIFRAAGAASGGGLFEVLDRLNQFVNSAQGQTSITSVFEELAKIFAALFPVLQAVVGQLPALAKGFAIIATAFGPALVTVVQALGPALASIAPAIASLATPIASLATLLQPLADILSDLIIGIAPGLTVFIEAFGEGLRALVPAAGPLGQAFGAILAALAPLLPLLGNLLAVILIPLSTALEGLTAVLAPTIELFATAFSDALSTLIPLLTEVAERQLPIFAELGRQLVEAFTPLIPVLLTVAEAFVDAFLAQMPQIIQLASELLPLIVQLAAAFADQLAIALTALIPYIPQIVDLFLQMTTTILQLAPVLIQQLIPYIPQLTQAFVDLLPSLIQIAQALLPLLAQVLSTVAQLVPVVAANWLQLVGAVVQIIGVLTPVITLIINSATALLRLGTESGAFKIILEALLLGLNFLPITLVKIVSGLGGFSNALGSAINSAGQFAKSVSDGIVRGMQAVITVISQTPRYFSGFGTLLYNAGRNLVVGLLNGIGSLLPQLFEYLQQIGKAVVDTFNAALGNRSPSKLAFKSGENFLRGFDRGVDDELPIVKRTLNQVSTLALQALPAQGTTSQRQGNQQTGPITVVAQFGNERFQALATRVAAGQSRDTARKVTYKPRNI